MPAGLMPALAGLLLAAAPPAPQTPVFRAGLDLVYLNVVVYDRQGRPVRDLSASDFKVFEDGQPRPVEVFGRAYEPGQDELLALDLGLLFDTSESMLNELKLSQEAAVRFLESVPRARDLLTIFFDNDIRISRYDSESQQGLFDRILQAKGGGQTALYDAVAVYLSRVADSPGRKVLVLFSDGEDSNSTLNRKEVMDLLKASAVTVYVIGFNGSATPGSGRALASRSLLLDMTQATGGALYLPSASSELGGIYERILGDLEAQYVIGYAPVDRKDPRAYRKLKVTARPGLKVRHREGYYAPQPALGEPPRPGS